MIKKVYILIILLLGGLALQAQTDSIAAASRYIQNGELDKAKTAIDAAATHAETSDKAQTWYLRGFIYKEIYKKQETGNKTSPARMESLESFKRSVQLDTADGQDNKRNIKFIAAFFFNDAASVLLTDTLPLQEYSNALSNYEKYKEAMLIVDPNSGFKENDIYIALNLANVYYKIYDRDRVKNEPFFEQAKELYIKALEIDSNNASANYHLAILYYNKAVNIIKDLDYDLDMLALMGIQEKTVEVFKQSLPYMEKAYQLNPQKKQTLIGLMGIYHGLNDDKKSNEIKAKLDSLEGK